MSEKHFKLRIHESNGNAFEDLFCEVMRASNKEFRKVKPQESIGERKNDGFIPSLGKYYQVYSPESPTGKPAAAISKLEDDLDGLIEFWRDDHNFDVKAFYFIFNDKYHGAYPQICTTLNRAL